jgi:isopentenyl-diphosphate delta-isomerase
MTSIPHSARNDIGLHEQITAIKNLEQQQYFPIEKIKAHTDNIRHVAVSIFIVHNNRLLLQKRAATKYHSAGLWANTVCSHPQWQESAEACASRRLQEELGWQVPLTPFGSIDYAARVGDLFENEHVHCFYGAHNNGNDVLQSFNPIEVEAVEWLTLSEVLQQIKDNPSRFTEWFKIYMTNHRAMIAGLLQ